MSNKALSRADPTVDINDGSRNSNPAGIGFWTLVKEDFETNDGDLLSQGFWALFWHRFGNWRMNIKSKTMRAPVSALYKIMYKVCQWWGGIMLPYTVKVGRRVRIDHFGGMILVAHSIGDDVTIRQNTTFGIASVTAKTHRPTIGNSVDIGAGAVLIGKISIGDRAIIGANAVVTQDVLPDEVVGGVPARHLKMRQI